MKKKIIFFPSMPVSLSRIIHHSHSFTRLEIYHHIYFNFKMAGNFLKRKSFDLIL